MSQIKRGAILSYTNLGINVLIGLIYTPWMIRSIGQADYGLYTLAMSIIGLLAFDFGLGNATTKFICEYLAQKRQDKVNSLMGMVYKIYLLLDMVIFCVFSFVYFFLPNIYDGLTSPELHTFKTVFIIAATYCILSFPFIPVNGILTGYEKFVQLKSCDLVQRLFIVATMAVCLILGYGLFALVIVNSLAGIIATVIKLVIIKMDTPLRINIRYWDKFELKRVFNFVIWITIIAVSNRCIFNLAPTILGYYANANVIAILGIAITFEGYTYLFTNAIGGLFLPRVSKIVATHNINEIYRLMVRVGRIEVYICMFILIWFVVFGRDFIYLWVGPSYDSVYACTIFFIIPIVFQIPHEIGMQYIIATNKVRWQSYIYILMAVVNLALAIPLTRNFGLIGISIAISIAFLIRTFCLDLLFHRKLGINILHFYRDTFIKLLFPMSLLTLLSWVIGLIDIDGWTGLIIRSLIMSSIYCVGVYYICANEEEKDIINVFNRS